MNVRRYVTLVVGSALAVVFAAGSASAMSLPFTYQGQLKFEGVPFDGEASFAFQLFDKEVDGDPIANYEQSGASVVNGLFTVEVLFEVEFDGRPLWLQIHVRAGDQDWTTLEPRQAITPAPRARGRARPQDARLLRCRRRVASSVSPGPDISCRAPESRSMRQYRASPGPA